MLALVWATQHFRPYLYGRQILVRTDHNALKWLQSFREPEGQVARWLERLAEFDIKVEHRPGAQHTNADALSRQSCSQCGQAFAEEPREDPAHVALVSLFPQWTQEEILAMQQCDPDLKQMMEWLGTNNMPPKCPLDKSHTLQSLWAQRQQMQLKSQILYRQWEDVSGAGANKHLQLVIPREVAPKVLADLHNSPVGGHLGAAKLLHKVRSRFYWVKQRYDVEKWCQDCEICSSRKSPSKPHRVPMQTSLSGNPMQ